MKKIIVLLVILLLLATSMQVAFADPSPPVDLPDGVIGSCNMVNSWWMDEEGNWDAPGNAGGVDPEEERGMFHVHNSLPRGESIGGRHMWSVTGAHCG